MSTMWKRMGTFLGFVEEYDDEYGEAQPAAERPAPASARGSEPLPARTEPSNVRRLPPARVEEAPGATMTKVRAVPGNKVHLTDPTTFNDVEEVGENFRKGIPVIMNLAGASEGVAKRLLDFASGLIFGLDGRIERVGDRVFLLTPAGVEVSTEERRRLTERGFFNQA